MPSGGHIRLNIFTGFTYFILVPACNHSFFGNILHLRSLLKLSRITRIKELIWFFNFLAYGKSIFFLCSLIFNSTIRRIYEYMCSNYYIIQTDVILIIIIFSKWTGMLIILSVKYICTRVQIIISNYGILIHIDWHHFNYYCKPTKYIFFGYHLLSRKYREDIII